MERYVFIFYSIILYQNYKQNKQTKNNKKNKQIGQILWQLLRIYFLNQCLYTYTSSLFHFEQRIFVITNSWNQIYSLSTGNLFFKKSIKISASRLCWPTQMKIETIILYSNHSFEIVFTVSSPHLKTNTLINKKLFNYEIM
jgi:hypothetical protein